MHCLGSHTMFDIYIIKYFLCELLNLYSFTVIDSIVKDKFTVLYHALCQRSFIVIT